MKETATVTDSVRESFAAVLKSLRLPTELTADLDVVYVPLAREIAAFAGRSDQPPVIGINGAQGSGKSTLCALLSVVLDEMFGLKPVSLSIDDIYLTRAEREVLAKEVHPLFGTRGVPGTHDIELGLRTISALRDPDDTELMIPRFDKSADDRAEEARWPVIAGPVDVILFEGWCVGTAPQSDEALAAPVNRFEEDEDPEGTWRRYSNERLRDEYKRLFDELDMLVMLAVTDMSCVYEWRLLQEHKLIEEVGESREGRPAADRTMSDEEVRRFIMHYERLTRHNLEEMPGRADIVLEVGGDHRVIHS